MNAKGGLPPIPAYIIERNHYLFELLQHRSFKRVHGAHKSGNRKAIQQQLCKLRKEKYDVKPFK